MAASLSRRLLAEQRDTDMSGIIRKGEAASRALIVKTREAVISAFARGDDAAKVVAPRLKLIVPLTRDAMVAAHLQSHYRVVVAARRAMTRQKKSEMRLSVYDEMLAFLQERTRFTTKQIEFLREEYGNKALAATEEATKAIEATVQRALLKVQKQGTPLKEATKQLAKHLESLGLDANHNQIETMIRTQTAIAQAVGQQRANQDPEIDEILWGYELFAVGDDRTRPNHLALDGARFPKNDPFWLTHSPPLGFNCRCRLVEVFEKMKVVRPKSIKLEDGTRAKPGADEGWGMPWGDVFGRERMPLPEKSTSRKPRKPVTKVVTP